MELLANANKRFIKEEILEQTEWDTRGAGESPDQNKHLVELKQGK